MIHRLLLIPTKATDPDRLLLDCRRMRLMGAAAVPQWVDVDLTDWRGTQARVLLDLPPIPSCSRQNWKWMQGAELLAMSLDTLGKAMGWRVIAVGRDGLEVDLG